MFPPAERDHHSIRGHRPAGPPSVPRPARGGRFFGPAVRPPVRPPPAVGGGRFASAGCGGRAGGPSRPPRAVRWPAGGPAVRWPRRGRAVRFTSVNSVYICKPHAVYICKPPLSIAGVNPVAAAVAIALLACATRLASRWLGPRSRSRPPAMPRAPTHPARPWRLPVRLPVALAESDPRGWPPAYEGLVCVNEYCPPPAPSTRLSHP